MGAEAPISAVVDTDILIDHLRGQDYARGILDEWSRRGLVAVSTLAHVEIFRGVRSHREEERTRVLLEGLNAVPISAVLARRAGLMISQAARRGLTISIADGIVAATALELDVPLLTNNIANYPFPEMALVLGRQ